MASDAKPAAPLEFADAVKDGLLNTGSKRLPCQFIYDEVGSKLFEEICLLPEYYPTRCELSIIKARSTEIAALCAPQTAVVEMGPGNAQKTRFILTDLRKSASQLSYFPIDVSTAALHATASALALEYPGLSIVPIAAEYRVGLRQVSRKEHRGILVLWLGTSIGNVEPHEAEEILRDVRNVCGDDGRVILGIDLKKDRTTLERAYNDAQGLTARFNMNLLARVNRELGGHFDLAKFKHHAFYNESASRIEMHLVSLQAQVVPIDDLRSTVSFGEAETIHTENSYKFSKNDISELAQRTGFQLEHHWTDAEALYSLNVFAAAIPRSEFAQLKRSSQ
jgi:dimethylhistidine N-methyltransferase